MKLTVNLRHLETDNVHLEGQLPVDALDIEPVGDVVRALHPLSYDLDVQKLEDALLATGRLELPLTCQCVRCLKEFIQPLIIEDYAVHLPFEGEDAVPVINDCADLTPYVREDILLEFPQHPLCDPGCGGLPGAKPGTAKSTHAGQSEAEAASSAWAELNKLKL